MELTWAGRLHQKGMELGKREGVELGRREGRREGLELGRRMLLKMAEQRFGRLPTSLVDRIAKLEDPARLDGLGDKVLSAKRLAELEELID